MVQEITGWRDNYIRRSGSMLPPPVDDFVDNEPSARKIPKVVLNVSCSLFLEPLEIVSVVSIFICRYTLCMIYSAFGFFLFFRPFFLCRMHIVSLKILLQMTATVSLLLFLLEPYGKLNSYYNFFCSMVYLLCLRNF